MAGASIGERTGLGAGIETSKAFAKPKETLTVRPAPARAAELRPMLATPREGIAQAATLKPPEITVPKPDIPPPLPTEVPPLKLNVEGATPTPSGKTENPNPAAPPAGALQISQVYHQLLFVI